MVYLLLLYLASFWASPTTSHGSPWLQKGLRGPERPSTFSEVHVVVVVARWPVLPITSPYVELLATTFHLYRSLEKNFEAHLAPLG